MSDLSPYEAKRLARTVWAQLIKAEERLGELRACLHGLAATVAAVPELADQYRRIQVMLAVLYADRELTTGGSCEHGDWWDFDQIMLDMVGALGKGSRARK